MKQKVKPKNAFPPTIKGYMTTPEEGPPYINTFDDEPLSEVGDIALMDGDCVDGLVGVYTLTEVYKVKQHKTMRKL